MKCLFLVFASIFIFPKINVQEFNKNINKDSLVQVIIKDLPKEKKKEFQKMYNEGNEQSKEYLLFMFSMPISSKKAQIENYEKNKTKIFELKNEYSKLVPDRLIVSIEFNPKNVIVNTKESIDLKIYQKQIDGEIEVVTQEWNLDYNSKVLNKLLETLKWNNDTLLKIKGLLESANCVSIENGKITTIGFARSGMGKYFYKVFDADLKKETIPKYNDGCTFIFYKDNIVLEYGGGAVGSQCFPDE